MKKINKIIIGTRNDGKLKEICDLLPKNINNRSDREQIIQTKNMYCFLRPCSITKIFWAPIANIRLNPVKKPNTRYSI